MNDLLILIFPFLISFGLEIASPVIDHYWKNKMCTYAKTENNTDYQENTIHSFINYADQPFGTIHMLTTLILTFSSGIVTLIFNRHLRIYLLFVLIVLNLIVITLLIVKDPHRYSTSGRWGYSPAAIYGMILNISFISTIIFSY